MAFSFQVSDVARATAPLIETPLRNAVNSLLGTPVEACGAGCEQIVSVTQNALLAAAWRAYADHRPLVLTPDAVWLCLAQGFAAHVNLHAEALRGRFVRHQGRETLIVGRHDFVKGSPDNPWPKVFGAFSEQIAGHIGRLRDLVVCDFSTTGPVERAASELVLMDAMQHYFKYEVQFICGIPEITLAGEVDDWRSVRRRAEMFAEYGLAPWTSVLVPVLNEFVNAASGRPDVAFWRHFFQDSRRAGCGGGTELHGWILLFFPYLVDPTAGALVPNPILVAARGASPLEAGGGPASWVTRNSVPPKSIPLGLSRAPLMFVVGEATYEMDLIGGFMGLAQDPTTLAVRPAIGWAVRDHAEAVIVRGSPRGRQLEVSSEDVAAVWNAPTPNMTATGAQDDGSFFVTESVLCSRASNPRGRLILDRSGLYFIPGSADGAALAGEVDNWLGRALSDDDGPDGKDRFVAVRGRPPMDQVKAVGGALYLSRAELVGLAVRAIDRRSVEIVVTMPSGERLCFVVPTGAERVDAWHLAMRFM